MTHQQAIHSNFLQVDFFFGAFAKLTVFAKLYFIFVRISDITGVIQQHDQR